MARKRDLVTEITEIRQRGWSHSVVVPFHVGRLRSLLAHQKDLSPEILRYFPIAAIACVESFARAAIRELVDTGSPYFERMGTWHQVKDFRFDLPVLQAIQGKAITAGDLISHMIALSSVANVETALSVLLGQSLRPQIETAVDPFARLGGQKVAPIISDADAVYRDMEETFRLRHIFAHEVAEEEPLPNRESVEQLLRSVEQFVSAASTVVWMTLYPNAPRTQSEMNEQAATSVQAAEDELMAELAKLRELAGETELLATTQEAWLSYRDQQARSVAALSEGGTIYPTILCGELEMLTRRRIEDVLRTIASYSPDGHEA